MISALVVATVVATAGAGLASPGVAVQAPEAEVSSVVKAKASRGVLRVKVIGAGKYVITGKGVHRRGRTSRSFALAPGRYRVKAPGAAVKVTRVRVRAGKTARVRVSFGQNTQKVGVVSRISTAADGGEGDWSSLTGLWSPDGTQVLMVSKATNLVPEPDINGDGLDIYIKTPATGEIVRVSTNSEGEQGNSESTFASWSPDGTKIVFDSIATNLVPDDTNDAPDVFVKDLATGAVQRVSTDAQGRQVVGSQSNRAEWSPDGTRIAFDSYAPTLVPNDTNGDKDVFVKTLATGAVERISLDGKGRQCAKDSRLPMWSPDSRQVMIVSSCAFVPSDTNKWWDTYVKDLATGTIRLVSSDRRGMSGKSWSMPDGWSPDGTKIAFTSNSSDLVADDTNDAEDVFVKNLSTGVVKRVSTDAAGGQGSEGSANSVWSPDGKHVAFTSGAPDLVPQDTNGKEDAFVKDLSTGAIERISVTSDGKQADNDTIEVTWSRDGERALIVSAAGNLVPDDTNGWFDVFITDTP